MNCCPHSKLNNLYVYSYTSNSLIGHWKLLPCFNFSLSMIPCKSLVTNG